MLRWLLCPLVVLVAFAAPALADTRVALVVANQAYSSAPLRNPVHDAALVTSALKEIGFDVTTVIDAERAEFVAAVGTFTAKSKGADIALFYYAGHGFALPDRGVMRNYLIPTSADLSNSDELSLRLASFPLDEAIDGISRVAKTTLIFIDACRNDPRVRAVGGSTRSLTGEDGAIGENVFVGLSTRAGALADDGREGEGSPFARAFAEHIGTSGMRIDDAFTRIRLAVQEETGAQQRPDISRDDLTFPVVLVGGDGGTGVAEGSAETPAPRTEVASLPKPADVALPAAGQEIPLGILSDLTGPLASLAGPMLAGTKLAFRHVNEQGGLLGGTIRSVVGDSQCNPASGGAAGEMLVTRERVVGIVGAYCTGSTIGAANAAGIAGNVVQISPTASSPVLTGLADKDLVFRTAASDAYQGTRLADLVLSRGIADAAVIFVNNDYGKGLAEAFAARFSAIGGRVTGSIAHEEGKASYLGELAQLARGGSTTLVVIAYLSGSGLTILREADAAGFTHLFGGDGMIGDAIADAGISSFSATRAGENRGDAVDAFARLATAAGEDPTAIFAAQSYDAGFLLALAVQRNGHTGRDGLSAALREVASPPGEKILPGEWDKAVRILSAGGDVDYEGAAGPHDFDAAGDVAGNVVEVAWQNGRFVDAPIP